MAASLNETTSGKWMEDEDRHFAVSMTGVHRPRYEEALSNARQGVWDWDLATDLVACSPTCLELLGFAPEGSGPDECPPLPLRDYLHRFAAEDLPAFQAAVRLHLTGTRPFVDQELRIHKSPTEIAWIQIRGAATLDEGSRPIRVSGTVTDVTQRRRMESQLGADVFHDPMTGLPNRVLLLDRIGHALDRARRLPGKHIAVAIIDLDRFKKINDALGSQQGDEALRIVAQRLEANRRLGDTLSRLSADEFCVILQDVADVEEAVAACERMSAAIAEPLTLGEHQLVLSCSIGITTSASAYESAEDMLRDCGLAVYRAKRSGRGRIDVYDRSLRRQAVTNMRTETDLRAALENGEFRLFYQPIVALRDRRIAGFEALMRWRHPTRGLVPPSDFIPLAEETGLIVPMGRWALREAARQLAEWRGRMATPRSLFMSVNVSFRQFSHDDLPTRVREAVDEAGIAPGDLKLEITESLLMHDPDHTRDVMEALRAMGVGVSIDDFGTGYSSLSYLNKLPAQSLKIDRSFVQAISGGENNAAIVQVVTTLATILGMETIAEGVELPEEATFLRDIMCRYAQGYLFAHPLPSEEVEPLLAREAAGEPLFDHLFPSD